MRGVGSPRAIAPTAISILFLVYDIQQNRISPMKLDDLLAW